MSQYSPLVLTEAPVNGHVEPIGENNSLANFQSLLTETNHEQRTSWTNPLISFVNFLSSRVSK